MIVVWVLLGVLLLHICFAMIELKCLTTTYYDIKSTKLPDNFGGLKIVLLSDIHCCKFGKDNERLFNKIKICSPDIIIVAGDMINGMEPEENKFAEKFVKGLKALGIPTYFTFGNHEERFKLRGEKVFADFANIVENNTTLLNNCTVHVRENIYLTGLDLPECVYKRGNHGDEAYEGAVKAFKNDNSGLDSHADVVKNVSAGSVLDDDVVSDVPSHRSCENNDVTGRVYKILVSHDPEYFERYVSAGADLVLSGHVHGGILRFPFVGGVINPKLKLFPEYDKGVFEHNGSKLVLSGGIGWHNLPLRFMNKPEVVVVTVTKE